MFKRYAIIERRPMSFICLLEMNQRSEFQWTPVQRLINNQSFHFTSRNIKEDLNGSISITENPTINKQRVLSFKP